MPAPQVYEEGEITPFTDIGPIDIEQAPYQGVLYATSREPVGEGEEERDPYYRNANGGVLRLGVATIQLGADTDFTWEEARRISLLKNRGEGYPLRVTGVNEFGVLDSSATVFTPPALLPADGHAAAARFANAVNRKLARSKQKDIYIYVHGYKVNFESPVLVASELWHFLGYEGVFIAYSWPATPSRWAYFGDLETTASSTRDFRTFLRFLADETNVERIHILGYSAGTRLVARALDELALIHRGMSRREIQAHFPIGQVILVAADVSRETFGGYLVDGLLDVADRVSIYVSEKDRALRVSNFLFGRRERLGQMWEEGTMMPVVKDYLRGMERLNVVNVTEAEGSDSANGHGYFRASPWASSDVLTTLLYKLEPGDRGLVRSHDSPVWRFPPDYIERLRATLRRVAPHLVERPAPKP